MLLVVQCDVRVPSGILGDLLRRREQPHRLVRLFDGDVLPPWDSLSAAVVLGGYMGVGDTDRYPYLRPLKAWLREAVAADLPLLGICLGGQLLAEAAGGVVHSHRSGEHGLLPVALTAAGQRDPFVAGIPPLFSAFQWHNDSFTLPPAALHLAASVACPGQIFRCRNAYGLQFHPEVNEAIVTEWCTVADAPSILADFKGRSEELQKVSLRLFENFLAVAACR